MIFIDSNVPMYLVGADHPNKRAARRVMERLVTEQRRLVTSCEVLQEVLHRYVAIRRHEAIKAAFGVLRGVVDEVFSIEEADVLEAKTVLQSDRAISARDALHVAVMRRRQISQIVTFDGYFDTVSGLVRVQ